jgi:hypothetical protein
MPSLGIGSPNNVNPVSIGNGLYEGKINLTVSGQWYTYDSIKSNGLLITPNSSFYYVFDVP